MRFRIVRACPVSARGGRGSRRASAATAAGPNPAGNRRQADGQRLTAAITKEAAEDLDLASGDDVTVIIKSTEVMIAKL